MASACGWGTEVVVTRFGVKSTGSSLTTDGCAMEALAPLPGRQSATNARPATAQQIRRRTAIEAPDSVTERARWTS
jgi:hypothetical protein